ncbi:MAG: GNAT family N-acetyltransferase [Chitinophagales bacterium]
MPTVLETERLRLRTMTMDDWILLRGILTDPVAMKYYPKPYDEQGTRDWVQAMLNRYERDGVALWIVEKKETGEFVGQVGPLVQKVDDEELMEVGWLLLRDQWGHGYATEAGEACHRYVFDVLGLDKVIALIRTENTPSRAVAGRLGMTVWKETMRSGLKHLVYVKYRK